MKKALILIALIVSTNVASATIHIVSVWDGYYQFVGGNLSIELGDTVQWLPLDAPSMVHTITSTNIPSGAEAFDQIWQAPADTFFQYIPQVVGLYDYECTPHAVSFGMIGSINVTGTINGIGDETKADALSIYPNPTTDFINFTELGAVYPYTIFNLEGKLVLSGFTNDIVDVSTLANGRYHIAVYAEKPRVMKFLKR